MHEIRFAPLEVENARLRVTWTVEPPTALYKQTCYTLDFSDALDPRKVPLKMWWTHVLLCLHSHWNLLRPCRVILPITLPDDEIEFWSRVLDNERRTLEIHRSTLDFERTVEIECQGDLLAAGELPAVVNRSATAFSGGKDSLLQTALLCEYTERPLLVNTLSPMLPFRDHTWPFRQRTLDEIRKRRDVELVVVKTDLRGIWSHYEFPHTLNYNISMGLLTDPFLYIANTLVVATSRGIRKIALAAEFECNRMPSADNTNEVRGFEISYTRANLGALDALFRQWQMSLTSLLSPFTHFQIEQLLRQRYPDLADLQISCWAMTDDSQQSCSRCLKCFRLAMYLLAIGEDPATLGMNVETLMHAQKDYDPKWDEVSGDTVKYAASRIKLDRARGFFPARNIWQRFRLQEPTGYRDFKTLLERIATDRDAWLAATHLDYMRLLPDEWRDTLTKISLEYWPLIDEQDHTKELALIDSTVAWMVAPLHPEK